MRGLSGRLRNFGRSFGSGRGKQAFGLRRLEGVWEQVRRNLYDQKTRAKVRPPPFLARC